MAKRWSIHTIDKPPRGGLMELEETTIHQVRDAKQEDRTIIEFRWDREAEFIDGHWHETSRRGVCRLALSRGRVTAHHEHGPPATYRLPDGARLITDDDYARILPSFLPWAHASSSRWRGEQLSVDIAIPPATIERHRLDSLKLWPAVSDVLKAARLDNTPPDRLGFPSRRSARALHPDRRLLLFFLWHDGHRTVIDGSECAPLSMPQNWSGPG